jgi:hypothetical protein
MVLSLVAAALGLAAAGIALPATADPPPAPHDALAVVAPARPVAPGAPVTLAARVPDGAAPPTITWDLDGDGRYDDDAGAVVRVRFGAADGPHRVRASALWLDGAVPITRTATATVHVAAASYGAVSR